MDSNAPRVLITTCALLPLALAWTCCTGVAKSVTLSMRCRCAGIVTLPMSTTTPASLLRMSGIAPSLSKCRISLPEPPSPRLKSMLVIALTAGVCCAVAGMGAAGPGGVAPTALSAESRPTAKP